MKGITVALTALAAVAAHAGSITIESAYPSDGAGDPVSIELGDTFYMAARLNVSGLNGPYKVRFDLPYFSRTTPSLAFQGDAVVVWGPFPALLDGQMRIQTRVLSTTDAVSPPLAIQVTPALPALGIEAFNPQFLNGSVGATARLASGSASGLQWFLPLPVDGACQQEISVSRPGTTVTSMPFFQPVGAVAGCLSVQTQFQVQTSSSRVNPQVLRTVGFGAYANLTSEDACWLQPETLIESNNLQIHYFVASILPSTYRQSMSPYDAAQKLFQAVVARMQYVTTTAKPDALVALNTRQGDCGYFAALFVAACRNAGIPARAVSGFTLGNNQWHVWAEFYVPGYGWIPADPAYCDALVPNGALPVYFGTIPELNQRAAVSYGFDHSVPGHSITMLQSPAVFASSGTWVSSVQPCCSLSIQP